MAPLEGTVAAGEKAVNRLSRAFVRAAGASALCVILASLEISRGEGWAADQSERDLAAVEKALATGARSPADVLSGATLMELHPDARFRELIRRHSRSPQTTIVTPEEPGERLLVTGTVRDEAGHVVPGALIYVYQTNAAGWYASDRPHILGPGGDEGHARLFGYMTTGPDGRYELRTIRPGSYPGTNNPQHIHFEVVAEGHRERITELLFDGDPLLTEGTRRRAAREGLIVAQVQRDESGLDRSLCDLVLP